MRGGGGITADAEMGRHVAPGGLEVGSLGISSILGRKRSFIHWFASTMKEFYGLALTIARAHQSRGWDARRSVRPLGGGLSCCPSVSQERRETSAADAH